MLIVRSEDPVPFRIDPEERCIEADLGMLAAAYAVRERLSESSDQRWISTENVNLFHYNLHSFCMVGLDRAVSGGRCVRSDCGLCRGILVRAGSY
jgi:hypothetical protein